MTTSPDLLNKWPTREDLLRAAGMSAPEAFLYLRERGAWDQPILDWLWRTRFCDVQLERIPDGVKALRCPSGKAFCYYRRVYDPETKLVTWVEMPSVATLLSFLALQRSGKVDLPPNSLVTLAKGVYFPEFRAEVLDGDARRITLLYSDELPDPAAADAMWPRGGFELGVKLV